MTARNHEVFPTSARTGSEPNSWFLVCDPALARKRVLLVDAYATKRDLRSKIMRKLGVDVDCAANIAEARSLWQADSYSLILVDVHNDSVNVQEFCDEVRNAKPPQSRSLSGGQAGVPGRIARRPMTACRTAAPMFTASGARW